MSSCTSVISFKNCPFFWPTLY